MILPVDDTPLHQLPGLARHLGIPPDRLWVKREDLTGLAGGGNKARKLTALIEDALAKGCNHLVTGGGAQSNHARMTAAAANVAGLRCDLVLTRGDRSGNVLLDELLGASITWLDGPALPYDDLETAILTRADQLKAEGRKPYAIPIGGSTTLGTASYARVAQDLTRRLDPDVVVVAAGSGGTQAGLAAGFGDHTKLMGVDVGARPNLSDAITILARAAATHLNLPAPSGQCVLDTGHIGKGYGTPTEDGRDALLTAARTDALLLDPVYTGKAMAAMLTAYRDGRLGPDQRVVFLHTGGLPGLFATPYTSWLTTPPAPPRE
ncbi:1-aminocyclopropane-1-carboxylate deaminase/D-cysteine desulfhydrase [Nonomuraea sp. NPDC050556]|uniref:1-aminocyclopropane-1-carboxylate deaminase/D-cysteine desulfhydrase n=1 Tax=Nonomuraea sp. NPDC050556 TaxID=3364369 RepID=UPI0037A6318C